MRRLLSAMLLHSLLAGFVAPLGPDEDIVLRGMGSFHVGGRVVEVTGKAVRMIVRQPGGPLTKLDPNGQYMVEQMYVQYFLPKNEGQAAAADVARRRPDRRHLRDHAGRPRRLDEYLHPQGLGHLRVRCGRARPLRLCVARHLAGEPIFLTYQDPFERFRIGDGEGSWNADPAKQKVLPGSQFPVEAYANYMKQVVPRWLSTDNAIIAAYIELRGQGLPLRAAAAQPGRRLRLQGGGAAARQDQGHRRGRVGDGRQSSPMRRS